MSRIKALFASQMKLTTSIWNWNGLIRSLLWARVHLKMASVWWARAYHQIPFIALWRLGQGTLYLFFITIYYSFHAFTIHFLFTNTFFFSIQFFWACLHNGFSLVKQGVAIKSKQRRNKSVLSTLRNNPLHPVKERENNTTNKFLAMYNNKWCF